MEQIFQLSPTETFLSNEKRIVSLTLNIVANELNEMSKPCYLPKFIRYELDYKKLTGFDENFLRNVVRQYPSVFRTFSVVSKNRFNVLIIYIIAHFIQTNNPKYSKLFYQFLALKHYYNIVYTYLPKKFCHSNIWNITFSRLSNKHLFRLKDNIPNSIMYLASEEFKRLYVHLEQEPDIEERKRIFLESIQAIYHRINQSLRSFFVKYYELSERDDIGGIREKREDEVISVQDIGSISSDIASEMTTYSQINKKAIGIAIRSSGINKNIAIMLIRDLSKVKYRDKIKFIIILINKINDLKKLCSERIRSITVRKILDNVKIHNYFIKEEIENLINSVDTEYDVKTINMIQLVSFFSHYLTYYIKTKVCK